jgi:hypothetical protein
MPWGILAKESNREKCSQSVKGEIAMKQQRRRQTMSLLCSFALVFVVSPAWSEQTVDHSLYGDLLNRYMQNALVDYEGLNQEEGKLDQYLQMLSKLQPAELPRNEQFALYINAYNAYTIKLILENHPVDSIKDIGGLLKSPWKMRFCNIGGEILTLDEIEHDILRPRFKDPRVHFAINCASRSCPPLLSEPYQGRLLDQQLEASARSFINDSRESRLEGNTLYVSKIFKWFEEDFDGDVIGFFLRYAGEDLRDRLLAHRDQIEIEYLDYDWTLNAK